MGKPSEYDKYMERFYITGHGTLLDVFNRETKNLDQSVTDTDKRLKKRLEILRRYYGEIKTQKDFNEEEYETIVCEFEKFVRDAETQK